MPDEDVLQRINALADEEHTLFDRESRGEASAKERARLQEIQVQLDQCWDLLHQRRDDDEQGLRKTDQRPGQRISGRIRG